MNAGGRGRFIALEGGEASGKSTQAQILGQRLGALVTREPGGTDLGRSIRELVLGHGPELAPRTEAMLMLADRAHHVATVVEPALAGGRHVVTDRFSASTLAYQGHGRGLDVEELRELSRWASAGLEPDLVVFLDLSRDQALARMQRATDRIEAAGEDFHLRVAEGYRALAGEAGPRWAVIDASPGPEAVAEAVAAALRQRGWLR